MELICKNLSKRLVAVEETIRLEARSARLLSSDELGNLLTSVADELIAITVSLDSVSWDGGIYNIVGHVSTLAMRLETHLSVRPGDSHIILPLALALRLIVEHTIGELMSVFTQDRVWLEAAWAYTRLHCAVVYDWLGFSDATESYANAALRLAAPDEFVEQVLTFMNTRGQS